RTLWVDPYDFDVWILLFQKFPGAAYCPAGPDSTDEVIDLSTCCLPDFRACCIVVRFWILWIVVLVGKDGIWCFSDDAFGDFRVTFGRFMRDRGRSDNHLGAHGP